MPQKSRYSLESAPEEIRAARIEDARQVTSRSPGRTRAALTSSGAFFDPPEVFEPLSGSRA